MFMEHHPLPDAQELDLVPIEQVNIVLGHPPLPAYPGQVTE